MSEGSAWDFDTALHQDTAQGIQHTPEPNLFISDERMHELSQGVDPLGPHPEPQNPFYYEATGSRCIRWLATGYPDDERDLDPIRRALNNPEIVEYAIECYETCPRTAKKHNHWYIILARKLRINQVSALFGMLHPHLRICDNNHKELKKYVTKDGHFKVYGKEPIIRQQKAADTVKEAAEETLAKYKNFEELLLGDFAFASKHERAAKAYYALKLKQATYKKPIIIWICGPTGTGKSALASYICGPNRFRKCGKLDWFDGYNGQECVTFDDFRKANCEWSFLLNILDHYKVDDMPVKGGFVPWRPKMIVFTSPNPPHVEFY